MIDISSLQLKRVKKSVVCLLLVSVVLASCKTSRMQGINRLHPQNPVIAHRGAFKKNRFPENSIASLREAVRLGCAGSEFDVRMTADDSLVINHDPAFHAMDIEKTTYAALSAYTLANGEKLPTLREYLLAGKNDNPHTTLVVEIKPSDISKARGQIVADKVVGMVQALDMKHQVVYISFDYEIVKRIHAIDKSAHTQYLNGDKTPWELKKDGISGADYHYSVFQKHPEWITMAKEAGIALNAWTVNDPPIMDWLLSTGFHYITTNEPEVLLVKGQQSKH